MKPEAMHATRRPRKGRGDDTMRNHPKTRGIWTWAALTGLFFFSVNALAQPSQADLREQSVGNPPASVVAGTGFKATDTVINEGTLKSAVSVTRYYLSPTQERTGDSILLTGTRNVKILKPGKTSSGKAKLTVPAGTAPGTYFFLACADDTGRVSESDETDNCLAAATQLTVPAYSQEDLTGTWTVNSLASGPGAPWWIRGAITINSKGKGTGLLVENTGGKDQVSLDFTISADGEMVIPGDDLAHCRMDAGKTFMACTGTWDDGTAELITITKRPAKTTMTDLAGNWGASLLATGPAEPLWERGILTLNAQGAAVFAGTDSEGDPDNWNRTYSVSKDGAITFQDSESQCRIDAHKTLMTCTDSWDEGSTALILAGKVGGSYSQGDLEGIWDLNALSGGPSRIWVRGLMTVEDDGSFHISTKDMDGYTEESDADLTIDSNGKILVSDEPLMECRMDAGKTVLFCTSTWEDGSAALLVFTKNPVPHTLQ